MTRHGFTVLAAVAIVGCGRSQTQGKVVIDSASGTADSVATTTPAPDTSRRERPPAVTKAPKTIEAVLAEHSDSIMAVPGVLGTAVGRCNNAPCIRVLVGRVNDEIRRRVPHTLEGYPVHIDVTGTIVPR
jgi:hypothetical protein